MSGNNKLVLDCDGVLLDWNVGFRAWMARHEFHEKNDLYYSISKRYGIEKASASQLVRQYNESAAVGFLDQYKDAREGLYALSAMGYNFDIVTAMSNYEYSQRLRERNLEAVFPHITFDRIFYTETGADKLEVLREHYANSGLFWIEDKVENAIHGQQVGMRPLLLRNPHHESETIPSDIPIFDTWASMIEYITTEDLY